MVAGEPSSGDMPQGHGGTGFPARIAATTKSRALAENIRFHNSGFRLQFLFTVMDRPLFGEEDVRVSIVRGVAQGGVRAVGSVGLKGGASLDDGGPGADGRGLSERSIAPPVISLSRSFAILRGAYLHLPFFGETQGY